MKRIFSVILMLTMLMSTTLALTACPKSGEAQSQQQYLPPQHQPRGGFRFITGGGELRLIITISAILACLSFFTFLRFKAKQKRPCKIHSTK